MNPHKSLLLSRNYIRASVTAVTINKRRWGWRGEIWQWNVTHNPQLRRTLRCGRVDWFFAPWRHNESSMRVMVKHGADIGTGTCSFVLSSVSNGGERRNIKFSLKAAHHFIGMSKILSPISCKLFLSSKKKFWREEALYYDTLNNYYRDIIVSIISK